jgi:tetratricopeptide (TPR) repeat protein
VRRLLLCLLGLLLAASRLAATTNAAAGTTNPPLIGVPGADDPVEREYKKLMENDDAAQAEVEQWIRDNDEAGARGGGVPPADLRRRIRDRLAPVRSAYDDFIRRHPDHARARVAYGSFLSEQHDEDGAQEQLEKALALDSQDPAAHNNLANLYGHTGQVKKAFALYAKAIELNPKEPIYYHNFGTTVYLFRHDAMEFYGISEQQVYDKALGLYRQAMELDPRDFPLAADVARTYYGIKPLRLEDALRAWTNTLALAQNQLEREEVYLHLARLKLQADRFAEVRAHLNAVTNEAHSVLKQRLVRNLDEQERKVKGTNAPPEGEHPRER